MSRYAILIKEDTLDLIQVLNHGVRPVLSDEPHYLVFNTVTPSTTENHKIMPEDDLYDDRGFGDGNTTFLM